MQGIIPAAIVTEIYELYGGEAGLIFSHTHKRRVTVYAPSEGEGAQFSIAQLRTALARLPQVASGKLDEVKVPIYGDARRRNGVFTRAEVEEGSFLYVHGCGQEYRITERGVSALSALLDAWAA